MKTVNLQQRDIRAVMASVVVAFALTGCGGPGGSDSSDEALKGPPSHSNSQGASVGVSNVCWIEGTNPALLFARTTVLDKTSGDEAPVFTSIEVQPLQKVRNNETPLGEPVDATTGVTDDIDGLLYAMNQPEATDPETREYAPFDTAIDLCAAGLTIDATSVNVNVRVGVFNSNNTYENSKCTALYEDGLKIGGMALCQ